MHFIDHFSKELRCDKLYVVVVVFRLRSYLVAGTFDVDLPDENQAIKALGCTGSFRGDLAICFYGMNRTNDLLYGMPRFPSSQERDEVLKAVVDRYVVTIFCNPGSHILGLSNMFVVLLLMGPI